jgi:hypothetical protein
MGIRLTICYIGSRRHSYYAHLVARFRDGYTFDGHGFPSGIPIHINVTVVSESQKRPGKEPKALYFRLVIRARHEFLPEFSFVELRFVKELLWSY